LLERITFAFGAKFRFGSAASALMTAVNLGSSPATGAGLFLLFGVFFIPAHFGQVGLSAYSITMFEGQQ
jgi:hypothetical protein